MKIVCSIGPKTDDLSSLLQLYREGMNGVRFNFSHAQYDSLKELVPHIREKMPDVELIQDLQGQKLRVSKKFRGEVKISEGERVIFCPEARYDDFSHSGQALLIPISFEGEFERFSKARVIFMKDASMEFGLDHFKDNLIYTTVRKGGIVRAEKGINAPGMDRSGLSLSRKDQQDLKWASPIHFDVVCLSFVTCEHEIIQCKEIVRASMGSSHQFPRIWAKIENREAIENFNSIVKHVDGIVLGRGDLTSEVGIYEIPELQERLSKKTVRMKKEFLVATYVLENMRYHPVPLVTECCEIWNCLSRKTTGFILTAEVAVGKYPIQAVQTLKKMERLFEKNKEK